MSDITCGTTAGYRQHQRHRTTPCKKCRAAQAAYMRQYRYQTGKVQGRIIPIGIARTYIPAKDLA